MIRTNHQIKLLKILKSKVHNSRYGKYQGLFFVFFRGLHIDAVTNIFTHCPWKLKLTNLTAGCLQAKAQVGQGTGGGKSLLHFILYLLNLESCGWIIYFLDYLCLNEFRKNVKRDKG